MAFTKAPTVDTYSSSRVHLYREMSLRDGASSGKDEDYVNIFIEPVHHNKTKDDRMFIFKRAGTIATVASVAASPIRGMFFWADQYKLFYCVGRNVYVYNVNTLATTTLVNVFATSSGAVGFCEFLYDNGSVVVLGTDGTATTGLVSISSTNVVVTSSNVNILAHLPIPIHLDGYVFLAKANSADVMNSVNNDPFTWTAGTLIQTEMEADLVVNITKLNNYLIAFGSESIEYFWDAGGIAPSSPMQRNDTPIKINRYLGGLAKYGNSLYYIGMDAGGQPDVFVLKDFKIESVGTPALSRYLDTAIEGLANWTGNIVSYQGHTFYVVTAGPNKTFAYDVDSTLWTRLAFQQNATFDINNTVVGTSNTNAKTYFSLLGNDSTIYTFDKALYQDNNVNYTCTFVTENNDFGTMNRKTMKRLSIIGDRPTANTNMYLSISDNDYQSYTTPRAINLNQDLPCVYQLGSFRQRVFKFTFTDNYPMRIQDVEVDINKGNS